MLKKRELNGHECHALFDLMTHPDVFPFVRQKANSYEEFMFLTKQTIEAEERGELISRTILDEWENPIGTINLFDIKDNAGFLGTWIGKPYHGKGMNTIAKEAFFQELFFEREIATVYMRIRQENIRSRKAAEKLPYTVRANESRPLVFQQLNQNGYIYDLYEVPKDLFTMNYMRQSAVVEELQPLEA
ncbi:GNAT family N-acetyltransferase [Lederbergia citrea]|uniref:GNAT family N-acetyltransferase n=1 Tax=Lederbergia citrea TaxID=2833581 RepID=A0A942Z335_9BACI|nr:GNAT family N-acetyltransferase [Lederbergia citrea]MBS4176664.1 GNAT family N-acetyltransferase [Lederbergia citrea]MBS4203225.1 GNAT family N-acetyltransferase [Lederbergia citrea]MBS4222104.1 GNAT family N-acetyltransferase [Lederbergia citrea]